MGSSRRNNLLHLQASPISYYKWLEMHRLQADSLYMVTAIYEDTGKQIDWR